MGLIHASNGEHEAALQKYQAALDLNPRMCQALNNMAVIFHYKGEQAEASGDSDTAETMFDEAARYWMEAINIAPNNYIEAQNWLKNTGRMKNDVFF